MSTPERRPTSINESFLEDIKANPDDSTSLLIYADYLQDEGREDEANLIRKELQWEKEIDQSIARTRKGDFSISSNDTKESSGELLEECIGLQDKVNEQFNHRYPGVLKIGFKRGIVQSIYPDRNHTQEFIEDSEMMLKENPLIDGLYFDEDNQSMVNDVIDKPFLKSIARLYLERMDALTIDSILKSEYLTNLNELVLSDSYLDNDDLRQILSYPVKMSKIVYLNLKNTRINDIGAQMLIDSSLPNLKMLNLSGNLNDIGVDMQQRLRSHFPQAEIIF